MSKNKFKVNCPSCNETLKKLFLGTDSYAEVECPHCRTYFMAKSTPSGVKTKCLQIAPTQTYYNNENRPSV